MKKVICLVLFSFVILFSSCGKSGKCSEYKISGNSMASSSYKEYQANALFLDTEEKPEISIAFENIEEDCFLNSAVYFDNLLASISDSIFLVSSSFTSSTDEPTVVYYILDGDVTTIEKYILLEDESNWIIFDSINSDSTEIKGRFNMSFVTSNEKILSGERERWDDPNRPDTLNFFDGEFLAVRNN